MKRKKKIKSAVDPDVLAKHQEGLKHRNRQVIYLNDKEMAAIDEYCRQFKVSSRSALYRQAIMEHILAVLDENAPTLF